MNMNQISLGHLFFHEDYEYFYMSNMTFCRSLIRHPIGMDGYRQGKHECIIEKSLIDCINKRDAHDSKYKLHEVVE